MRYCEYVGLGICKWDITHNMNEIGGVLRWVVKLRRREVVNNR